MHLVKRLFRTAWLLTKESWASVDFKRKILLVLYLFFSILLIASLGNRSEVDPQASIYTEENRAHIEDAARFTFGIDVINASNIDLESRTFSAQGWAWLKWKELPEWIDTWEPEVADNPVLTLAFVNAFDRAQFHQKPTPSKPYLDSDGSFIQWLEFSGSFYIDKIDLRKFPFHSVELPLEMEFDDFYANESEILIQDAETRLIGSREFTGYKYDSDDLVVSTKKYNTTFGMAAEGTKSPSSVYDNIRLTIRLKRDLIGSFFLIFTPLLASMIVTFSTPLINPRHYDTKVALPASVLLVLVFLQQGYQRMIPETLDYITFADYIYTLSILVTISTFLWSLKTSNEFLEKTKDQLAITKLKTADKRFCAFNVLYFSIMACTGWILIS